MRHLAWFALAAIALAGCSTQAPDIQVQGTGGDPPHPLRNSEFSWEPHFPRAGEEVVFAAHVRSSAPGDEIVQLIWDFGRVQLTDAQPTYTFDEAGAHDVSLQIRTSQGGTWTVEHTVDVLEAETSPEAPAEAPENATTPATGPAEPADEGMAPQAVNRTHVVVATFDTGTNPFHPCFRRPGADAERAGIPDFPQDAARLALDFQADYAASLTASRPALDAIEDRRLHHILETRLMFYGAPTELVDDYPHGAQASSQIACAEYGLAPDVWLVVLNWYDDTSRHVAYLDWVRDQPWIDIVHLNIQDLPYPLSTATSQAIAGVIDSGKLVVIAAGNGVGGLGANYPMELSSYNGPVGSLIAGANENGGYEAYTNLNPHVVMDGCGTLAAAPDSFGETTFSGTSSASPRITGYAGRLLADARAAYMGLLVDGPGLIDLGDEAAWPQRGPLADGRLEVAELHEVIRKTADPNPHDSWMDGSTCLTFWVPQPVDLPYSFYPKMGYGEVSEHTIGSALDVLLGAAPMPERPVADTFYEASTTVRETYWG